MALADGSSVGAVERESQPDAKWESTLSSALNDLSSEGVDLNAPVPADDGAPAPTTTQAETPSSGNAPSPATGDAAVVTPPSRTPAKAETAQPQDDDPFKDAKPMAYMVNGESRSLNGTFHLPGEGVYIPEAEVPAFQMLASRADALSTQLDSLTAEQQALNPLLSWTPPGANQPVSGRAAIEALHLSRAELMAEVKAYQTMLSDPENLRNFLVANEDGSLAWNQLGAKNFLLELDLTKQRVGSAIRDHFAKFGAQSAPANPASPSFDARAKGAEIVDLAIKNSADSPTWAAHLSPEDKTFLAGIAHRYVRPATAEDVRKNPALKVGSPFLEGEFIDLTRERGMKAGEAARAASTAAEANKFNQGMNGGKKPVAPPKRPPSQPPATAKKPSKQDQWDGPLSEFLTEQGLTR